MTRNPDLPPVPVPAVTRGEWGALALLMAVGLGLRLWAIGFGLPNTLARPDEEMIVQVAVGFFSGDPNPHNFFYGTLFMYLLYAVYAVRYLLLRAAGAFAGPIDVFTELFFDPSFYYLAVRGLSAAAGTALIAAAFLLGRRMAGRTAGWAAAVLTAVCHLCVRESHFGVTDSFLAFLTTLSAHMALKAGDDGSSRAYAGAGLTAGLAASAKYVGCLLPVTLFIAHLRRVRRERGSFSDRRGWAAAGAFVAGFAGTSPYVFLEAGQALRGLRFGLRGNLVLGSSWGGYLFQVLPGGLGWPFLFLGLAGVALLIRRDWGRALVFFSFPALQYFFAARTDFLFARYMLTVVPFLAVAAGAALASALARAPSTRARVLWGGALGLLAAGPTLWDACAWNRLLAREDTRVSAAAWISGNLPAGSSLFQAASPWGRVQLPPTRRLLEASYRRTLSLGGTGERTAALLARMDRDGLTGHEDWRYDGAGHFHTYAGPAQGLPDAVVVELSPFDKEPLPPAAVLPLGSAYRLAASFDGLPVEVDGFSLLKGDIFYMPYHGFASAPRPGPTLRIYVKALSN